jgi:hypothetical protein
MEFKPEGKVGGQNLEIQRVYSEEVPPLYSDLAPQYEE